MPRLIVSQLIASLGLFVALAAAPALADETATAPTPVAGVSATSPSSTATVRQQPAKPAVTERTINPVGDYARVLRAINPHLPEWQRRKYAASVLANAQRTQVDPRFIMAIVTVESSWRSNAVSRAGARGLGQLMPGTAARLDVNARDAAENLRGTATYLKSLLDRFRGQQNWFEKAIAGYNAGPNAVKRYGGIPPFAETQRYVVKVLRVYRQFYGTLAVAWSPYVSHRRELTRRDSGAAVAGAFLLAPIPEFKSSF
jgi:soluble lytic murein transglycosylase-like protein